MKLVGLLAAIALAGGVGCSVSGTTPAASTGGGSTTLTIAGVLGSVGSSSVQGKPGEISPQNSAFSAVAVADLKFYAIAFTSPPVIAEANVGTDGSFSVDLPGAKGSSVTAIFKDKNDDSTVGTIVFEDNTKKDLNGNNKKSSSVVLTDTVTLGTISLGSDGKVVIPITQIAAVTTATDAAVAVGTAFDFTGTWTMAAYDGTLPTGYATVGSDCSNGPCAGFNVTFVRMAGKEFTPNGSCTSETACASTAGTEGGDAYALSIWGGNFSQGIGACGSKMGFTADEVRYHGRINVSTLPLVEGNTVTFGPYVYGVKTGFGGDSAPFNLPWMKTGATASYSQRDCRPHIITKADSTTVEGWACKAEEMTGAWPGTGTGNFGWQVSVQGGGCINNATSKPVNVTNWSNIGFGSSCEHTAATAYGAGFNQDSCTYTSVDHDGSSSTPAISMTCTHIGGQFTDSGNAPSTTAYTFGSSAYLGEPAELVASGQLCSSIGSATDAQKLAAYRCYAEAYWQGGGSSSTCDRDYRFNWSAVTPESFADDSGRGKPKNAFITNILSYSADGQSATIEDEETETLTLPTGANSSTFCEVGRRTLISLKKVSNTQMLFDLQQKGQMNSTDAACQAAGKQGAAGTYTGSGDLNHLMSDEKMIFYVTK